MSNKINKMPVRSPVLELTPTQMNFDLEVKKQAVIGGIGMGVLSDGTTFLHQRGLALLCGVENAHIGTISSQWSEENQKPTQEWELLELWTQGCPKSC